MQFLDDTNDFGKRAAAINAEGKKLADQARVARSTVSRFGRAQAYGRLDTARKLMRALEEEEIRIARHLMTLPHVRAALADHSEAAE